MAGAETCQCGNPISKCVYVVQQQRKPNLNGTRTRWTHYRCPVCLQEWTITEEVPIAEDPVSAEEVVDVHELMKDWERPLKDLLG